MTWGKELKQLEAWYFDDVAYPLRSANKLQIFSEAWHADNVKAGILKTRDASSHCLDFFLENLYLI